MFGRFSCVFCCCAWFMSPTPKPDSQETRNHRRSFAVQIPPEEVIPFIARIVDDVKFSAADEIEPAGGHQSFVSTVTTEGYVQDWLTGVERYRTSMSVQDLSNSLKVRNRRLDNGGSVAPSPSYSVPSDYLGGYYDDIERPLVCDQEGDGHEEFQGDVYVGSFRLAKSRAFTALMNDRERARQKGNQGQ